LTCEAFGGRTVESKVTELAGKIGERITFRRFHIEPCDPRNERIFTYLHGTRIGVLAKLTSGEAAAFDSEHIRALGKDIAMQVAASSPIAVSRDTIDAEVLAKEREIYLTQAQSSGKPEKIWDKIVEGKLSKFYKEFVLVEQQYIRNTEISVSDRIKQVEKECGSAVTVVSFVRYELGTVQ
jgi:elongation factor Ts